MESTTERETFHNYISSQGAADEEENICSEGDFIIHLITV